jgi:hypothetical protein
MVVDEIPDKEFKRIILRMINKIKVDTDKHLNEFKGNTNKQLKEIMMVMQDMKQRFNK